MNFETIDKLPLHPLVVHAPIVLIPLVTIAIIITSFKPEWHKAFAIPVGVLTFASLVTSYLAKESGEFLEEKVRESQLLEEHAELGDAFFIIALIFTIIVVAWCLYPFAVEKIAFLKDKGKAIRVTLCVITIAFSIYASYDVYRVGHSGARSVWHDTATKGQVGSDGGGGEENEG